MNKINYLAPVPTPPRTAMNSGLSPAKHATMLRLLGRPGAMTRDCSPVTNETLKKRIITRDIAPHLRVTGFNSAVISFEMVMNDIREDDPTLWGLISTAGMLCCRAVRGSTTHFSNHSWGTAIDLKIGGILAPLNAKTIPLGLKLIYPYFHRRGWFWAAGYNGRTDPMHFETAQETLLRWEREGVI